MTGALGAIDDFDFGDLYVGLKSFLQDSRAQLTFLQITVSEKQWDNDGGNEQGEDDDEEHRTAGKGHDERWTRYMDDPKD